MSGPTLRLRRLRLRALAASFLLVLLALATPAFGAERPGLCFLGEDLDLGEGSSEDVGTMDLVAADVDEDGWDDLLLALRGDGGGLGVLLGTADGHFSDLRRPEGIPHARRLEVADFDGDGHVDVVTVDEQSQARTVTLSLGNGDATFRAPRSLTVGFHPFDIAVGDFDGDGNPDLATVEGGDTISLLLGHGDGTFDPRVILPVAPNLQHLAAKDLNADGLADLVAVSGWPTGSPSPNVFAALHVLLAQGAGAFSAAASIDVERPAGSLRVVDVNADTVPDIALTTEGGIQKLRGRGDGSFEAPVPLVDAEDWVGGFFALVDVNGNGADDLVMFGNGEVRVRLGDGAGGFGPASRFASSGAPMAALDLDRDGAIDLVLSKGRSLVLDRGRGDGSFVAPSLTPADPAGGYYSMAVGDFDGNQSLDVALASMRWGSESSVQLMRGDGTGALAAPVVTALPDHETEGYSPPVAHDLDGDGLSDLVLPLGPHGVGVLRGTPDGHFEVSVFPAGSAGVVGLGDFDGDGIPDLVAGDDARVEVDGQLQPGALYLLLGLGAGQFAPAVSTEIDPVARSLAVDDFNGDGVPDVAVLSNEYAYLPFGALNVLLGTGQGGFEPPIRSATSISGVTAMVAGDFNGDTIPDLVLTNAGYNNAYPSDASLRVQLGNGDGSFGPELRVPAPNAGLWSVWSMIAADADGDGRLDVITANSWFDVSLFQGKGDGSFQPVRNFLGGPIATAVAIADLQGNGLPDLVVSSIPSQAAVVLPNCTQDPIRVADRRPAPRPRQRPEPAAPGPGAGRLLGSDRFDVADVDRTSLAFGPAGAFAIRGRFSVLDPNGDGFSDLLSLYRTRDTGIALGDARACLRGELRDGDALRGLQPDRDHGVWPGLRGGRGRSDGSLAGAVGNAEEAGPRKTPLNRADSTAAD